MLVETMRHGSRFQPQKSAAGAASEDGGNRHLRSAAQRGLISQQKHQKAYFGWKQAWFISFPVELPIKWWSQADVERFGFRGASPSEAKTLAAAAKRAAQAAEQLAEAAAKEVPKRSRVYSWLVVWNMFFSPYIGNHHPNWLRILIFFRGVETTNLHDICCSNSLPWDA